MDSRAYASFNIMFLGKKYSELYWQAVKDYQWRVLGLSILLTVLSILIVNTIPSTYLGTAKLAFSPLDTAPANGAYLPFADAVNQQQLTSIYEQMLLENIAKSLLIKLTKFKLTDLDSKLENAISEYLIITQIKQKIRTILPFMPQQSPPALSSKQLGMLKNNYTTEQLIQNFHLRYSSGQREVYIDYKDRSATFAIIIAKLAADLYMQCVSETQMQMFEHVHKQIKLDSPQSDPLTNTIIGNYTTQRLKPNKALIISSCFFLSLLVISSLVWILVRLKSADRQTSSSPCVTDCKSSK